MIIGIIGPTASGKSAIAEKLAEKNCMIINADSQQLYKHLPILSSQPSMQKNHVLYEILQANEEMNVVAWVNLAKIQIEEAKNKGLIPVVVGGTGMYFKVLQEGIAEIPHISKEIEETVRNLSFEEVKKLLAEHDPQILEKIQDKQRLTRALAVFLEANKSIQHYWDLGKKKVIEDEIILYSLLPPKVQLHENIEKRIDMMFPAVFEEVKNFNYETSKVIGFEQIKLYLNGEISKSEMRRNILIQTRQYAKRQYTYIRNSLDSFKVFDDKNELLDEIMLKFSF